ncbi:hypothetical protein NB311A_01984 [Nitrobacter sp. Nb-311A]|nr:hypothetical protein NB311A_01984 [Nitrobacter sp. Nb-311A]
MHPKQDGEMRKIERKEGQRRGTVTYQLDDGRYVTLDENAVAQFGAGNLIQWLGIERVPVMHRGRRVGTLPADFEPLNARRVCPGDLKREGDVWVAEEKLAPENLDAVMEFERDI